MYVVVDLRSVIARGFQVFQVFQVGRLAAGWREFSVSVCNQYMYVVQYVQQNKRHCENDR